MRPAPPRIGRRAVRPLARRPDRLRARRATVAADPRAAANKRVGAPRSRRAAAIRQAAAALAARARTGRRARAIAVLTGLSAWRGFLGFYDSDNLTYAASIAYYALLSLFPFFLLSFALLGRATADVADRNAVLTFVLRYFPTQFDFITKQLDEFRTS